MIVCAKLRLKLAHIKDVSNILNEYISIVEKQISVSYYFHDLAYMFELLRIKRSV